jgi:AcrR family transcriptional regulator
MSTTPSAAHQPFSASPPVSLTERRKAETRMEIARAAAALFVRQGLRATRAEDIAQAAGIAPRTFYRYFATKEEAVAPLYAAGAQRWAEAVRSAPAHLTVPEALEHAVHTTLTPGVGVSAASWEWVRTLIRLAGDSPALRKVWAEVCQASEQTLAEILAARTTSRPLSTHAAGVSDTSSSDTGEGAEGNKEPEAEGKEGDEAGGNERGEAGGSKTGEAGGEEGDATGGKAHANVALRAAAPAPATPDLRFAAAVAGAAVRVAVESWAATSSPPAGPNGPAALALHNLGSLRGFNWDGGQGCAVPEAARG